MAARLSPALTLSACHTLLSCICTNHLQLYLQPADFQEVQKTLRKFHLFLRSFAKISGGWSTMKCSIKFSPFLLSNRVGLRQAREMRRIPAQIVFLFERVNLQAKPYCSIISPFFRVKKNLYAIMTAHNLITELYWSVFTGAFFCAMPDKNTHLCGWDAKQNRNQRYFSAI